MEPQENKQLALRKAITAYEQAGAALADLMAGEADSDPRYSEMLQNVERTLEALRGQAETTRPTDKV
jgi:hypothetical protein